MPSLFPVGSRALCSPLFCGRQWAVFTDGSNCSRPALIADSMLIPSLFVTASAHAEPFRPSCVDFFRWFVVIRWSNKLACGQQNLIIHSLLSERGSAVVRLLEYNLINYEKWREIADQVKTLDLHTGCAACATSPLLQTRPVRAARPFCTGKKE